MVIQISVAVLTAALCVLVVALVQTLRQAKVALEQIGRMTDEARVQVTVLTAEVKETMQSVTEVTQDVKGKMEELHSVFETVGEIGRMAGDTTQAVRQTAVSLSRTIRSKLEDKPESDGKPKIETIPWLMQTVRLIQSFRRKRAASVAE
ncbi:MAG: hypothetical protein K0R57_5024 [Paenibacillaceae bacterium]|jgi:uncharacterized protein YoxC|nr:hypothetical protein [Paenibacillaceae bacterium]